MGRHRPDSTAIRKLTRKVIKRNMRQSPELIDAGSRSQSDPSLRLSGHEYVHVEPSIHV